MGYNPILFSPEETLVQRIKTLETNLRELKQDPTMGGGSVASVFGRTGAVVAVSNDYTWAQINKATSSLADLATKSAAALNSGTLDDARLSTNVVMLTGAQTLASKTLTTPTIASFTNAQHDHTNAAGGGQIPASALGSGTIATGRLGGGFPDNTNFLRGDQTWASPKFIDLNFGSSSLTSVGAPTADYSMNSHKLTGVTDPTADQDAATKAYVDAVASGLDLKKSVRLATTGPGTLASSFENGDTVDGVVLATGDRILLKDQAAGAENGIYVVAASGAPTRSTDADTSAEVNEGMFTFVEEGTANADSGWVLTNDAVTLGTTALTFAQFSGAGQITAGAGMTKSGNTLDVVGTTNRIVVAADSIDVGTDVVVLTGAQSLASKTLDNTNAVTLLDTNFTLQDNVDPTKQVQFQLSGLGTGTTRTLVLPNGNFTLATTTGTETWTNKTLTAPTIADFTNMGHDHLDADDGGTLTADAIAAGVLGVARLGTGTPTSGKWLRGDGAWETLPAGGSVVSGGGSSALLDSNAAMEDIERREDEITPDFTKSGGIWSLVSGLNGTMTAWAGFVAGKRLSISTVASRAFTASKDTYVDINPSGAGSLVYTEVTNAAAAPALTAGYYRLAKVVTNGSTITSVNSGVATATQFDSLGNRYRRTDPYEKLLGGGRRTSLINPAGALTEITELSMTVIIPRDGFLTIEAYSYYVATNIVGSKLMYIYDTNSGGTMLSSGQLEGTAPQTPIHVVTEPLYYAAGTKTFKVYVNGPNVSNFNGNATSPLWSRCKME